MSNYSFILPQEVYRWLVVAQILPNRGQLNEKGQVILPPDLNAALQNGITVAEIIAWIFTSNGQKTPETLQNFKKESSRAAKQANWNLIWLSFDDLRLQFDFRIKDLILQGQHALITEILKQLYDKDEQKDEQALKNIYIMPRPDVRNDSKIKAEPKNKANALDIKKINSSKDPSESESSLEFLLLLLTSSLNMPPEQVLGLFTNQNKYLAHLFVKGVNQDFTGVVIFYTMLQKNISKLKEFCAGDRKDAESCLYALKPGLISKNIQVAHLAIQVFSSITNIYEWFVSDAGKCSTTLLLGIKRHPSLVDQFWALLLEIIANQEVQYFTKYFRKSFKDPSEMIEICSMLIQGLSQTFLRQKLLSLGVIQEWIEIAVNLFQGDTGCKLVSYNFLGRLMRFIPEAVESSEDTLTILKRGWKERNLLEFVTLFDEILDILVELAGEKNTMARSIYQIVIDIFGIVRDQPEKHEYLIRNFIEVLPSFPKIPTQYLIEHCEEMQTYDFSLIKQAISLSIDPTCLTRIGDVLLKIFCGNAVVNYHLAPCIYSIARKCIEDEGGKLFVRRCLKELLGVYAQLEVARKIPQLAKQQPMYFLNKGNTEKLSKENEGQYVVQEKEGKNLFALVEKLTDFSSVSEELAKEFKFELMEAHAFIRKNNYKVSNKPITNLLSKKFNITKQDEALFDEDYRLRHPLPNVPILEESLKKKSVPLLASSRYGSTMKKEFNDIVEKRKKEEEQRHFEEDRRAKDELLKKEKVKKQVEKTNLLRGFAQQAELKEDGFWAKFCKEDKEVEVYPPALMEPRDTEYIDCLFKKYHRVLRALFLKYTSSMYSTKQATSFEESKERTETLSMVELLKLLKDYKLMFLTSVNEVQSVVRDLNVKLLNKRDSLELDFSGFEQFVIQFCAVIYTKTHTLNSIQKNLMHLSHLQLVEEWFHYLKLVSIQKGENVALFQEPQAAYFNQTEVIKEFNRKIEMEPGFILPEGYKKVTEKGMKLVARYSSANSGLAEGYSTVLAVLDEILWEMMELHLLQPMAEREIKVRVKPQAFLNVKPKLLEDSKRISSSDYERKSLVMTGQKRIPPIKMMDKRTLTFGMRLGLSYVSYKDKMLGEQVAYVLDDMLWAVENNRTTIEKDKIINQVIKKRQEQTEKDRYSEVEKEKRRLERKEELEKMKKDLLQKKQKAAEDTKEERQKKAQKEKQEKERLKQEKQKYLEEQKERIKEKKKQEEEIEKSKKPQEEKKKQDNEKKEKFKDFNTKQLEKVKKLNQDEIERKKKALIKEEDDKKSKDELVKKLRSKIQNSDKKAIEAKQKTNEEINELYNSAPIKSTFTHFESAMRSLYDFLVKHTFYSLTDKKHNGEIIAESWHEFALIFQLTPFIINARDLMRIFKGFTKQKQMSKEYFLGLSFDEFEQALLRIAIRHKSIFNKLSEKIKDTMSTNEINEVVERDIQEKEKNEFEEPKDIDVRGLMKEEDIDKHHVDQYGDISKVNVQTLKGLIYYLKVPNDKLGQEKRFRQILNSQIKYGINNAQQLKSKLNEEYSLLEVKKQKQKEKSPPKGEQNAQQ